MGNGAHIHLEIETLYRWACGRKCLPEVNRAGKARGFPPKVSEWLPIQVETVYRALTEPAVNGQATR